MNAVIWSEAATTDLSEIRDYLIEAYSPIFAQHIIDSLVLATDWLMQYPRAGSLVDDGPWRKWKPRHTRYLLIYQPVVEGIAVYRVRHDRNDWKPVPE